MGFNYAGEAKARKSAARTIRGAGRLFKALDRTVTRAAKSRERNARGRWIVILLVLLGLAASWIIAGRLMPRPDVQQTPSKAAP